MKAKFTHVIQRTSQNGNVFYLFIAASNLGSKAVTVFPNVPCIGADSIDNVVVAVSALEPGEFIELDFVPDITGKNIACCIVST